MAEAALPTYRTAARVLEQKKGAGLQLAGWTILRTIMIAPPMMVVGVDTKTAFLGAGLASILISTFTLVRLFDHKNTGFAGTRGHRSRFAPRPSGRHPRRR